MFYRLHFTTMRAARMEPGSVYLTQGQYRSLEQNFRSKYVAQIESQNKQIEDLIADLQQASAEYSDLQLQFQELQIRFDEADAELATLQEQLRAAQARIESLETQLAAANANITSLTNQLQEANLLAQGLQGQLDILRNFGLWPNAVEAITTDTTLAMNTLVTMAFPSGWGGSYVCSYQLQNDNQLYYLNPTQGVVGFSINWLKSLGQILWADSNGNSRLISNVQSVRIEHNATFNNRIIGFYYND